jgi:hypothetical protein
MDKLIQSSISNQIKILRKNQFQIVETIPTVLGVIVVDSFMQMVVAHSQNNLEETLVFQVKPLLDKGLQQFKKYFLGVMSLRIMAAAKELDVSSCT